MATAVQWLLAAALLAAALLPAGAYTCDNSLLNPGSGMSAEKVAGYERHAVREGPLAHVHLGHDHVGGAPAPGEARAASYASRAKQAASPPELAATLFPLSAITLLPGGRGRASQDLTQQWLRMFDPDRLLFSFRVTANLSTRGAQSYGGWESPQSELRGHITGGHFLSASAQMINSTGDVILRNTTQYLVSELAKCQAANGARWGVGYLAAYGTAQLDCLESAGANKCTLWAPYYTTAKQLRGLFDLWRLTGNDEARVVAEGMLGYYANRIRNFIAAQTTAAWWPLLNAEFGGMNDVAWLFYGATGGATGGNADALFLAGAFSKACLLGPMSLGEDYIANIHANTHIPIVVGAAQGYEVTGTAPLAQSVQGYYDAVTGAHTYATGGSSSGEWWGAPHRTGDGLTDNNVESCSTYNTIKVARHLFTWSLDTAFLDFYERAKFSGMFGTQHPRAVGRVIYMLPMQGEGKAGGSKAHTYYGWSDPLDAMWCCVGSGMETHSKHGELLFLQQGGGRQTLLVTLYDAASVAWQLSEGATVTVTQAPTFTATSLAVNITVSWLPALTASTALDFAVALRIPGWATMPTASVNGQTVPASGSWFNVSRSWAQSGDVITATFPITASLEHLDDDRPQFSSYKAVIAGPYTLGAHTHTDNVIVGDNSTTAWLRPLSDDERARSLSLTAPGLPGVASFLRHDSNTSLLAALLKLPSSGGSDNVTFTLQPPGFVGAGEDVYHGNLTLAQAEAMCVTLPACVAITWQGTDVAPSSPVDMYLKSGADYTPAVGWTTYISSRVGDPFGGDEDLTDSTFILDSGLSGGASQSLRSLNRPGEYVACPALGEACGIAHDITPGGGTSAAFNASASFLSHSPGLTGAAGSVSYESIAFPGAYLTFFDGAVTSVGTVVSVQTLSADGAFAAASTFVPAAPNYVPSHVAWIAHTSDGSVAGSRDLLLTPVADFASEYYGVYLQVQALS